MIPNYALVIISLAFNKVMWTKIVFKSQYIQGDSGGICTTLGYDSMGDSKQKISYEHGSDFERLQSYDRLKLGIEGNDN